MDFVKCKLCATPFFSRGSLLCPACQEQIDKDFILVRDYIYDHPQQASVDEVAEATGVAEKNIIYLLEEERLTASVTFNTSAVVHRCKFCGREISSGSICERCKSTLTKDLDSAAGVLNSPEKKASVSAVHAMRGVNRDYHALSEYGKKK